MDIKEIPKVELHCHLEACFSLATAMEIAQTLKLNAPRNRSEFRREWLITEPLPNLEVALQKFVNIQSLCASEEIIERLTFETCEYAVEQGIKILELRYAPNFIASAHPHLSFDKIHQAVLKGLARAADLELAVGVIGIIQKTLSTRDAASTTDFIIDNRDTFLAVDLADQDIGDGVTRFKPLLNRARRAGLRITAHAGEEPVAEAPQYVQTTITELGAERIGHGIHIINDPAVMEFVRERDVLLEICPTSNWLTSSVASTAEHPIRRLMEHGVPISINSDDPGLFGIDLCHEYQILRRQHNFTDAEFDHCNDLAAKHSFLDRVTKQRVWPRPIPESSTGTEAGAVH